MLTKRKYTITLGVSGRCDHETDGMTPIRRQAIGNKNAGQIMIINSLESCYMHVAW